MKNRLIPLLLAASLPYLALSQNHATKAKDSLLRSLRLHTKDDTTKVNIINTLSRAYYLEIGLDSALFYGQEALKLADKLNFKKGTATAYRYLGNFYSDNPDSTQALAFYRKALAICKQIDDKQGMVANLRNIGIVYKNHATYPQSLDYYEQALDVVRQMGSQALMPAIIGDIGEMFLSAANYAEALKYYQEALSISEKSGDKSGSSQTLMKIGWLYRNLGESTHAIEYLEKSLDLNRQINNKEGIADCLSNLANIYMGLLDFDKSIAYYNKAIEITKTTDDKLVLANEYTNVAGLYQIQSNFITAVKYLDSAEFILNKYPGKYGQLLYLQTKGRFLLYAPDSVLLHVQVNPDRRYHAAIENNTRALQLADELNIPMQKGQALGNLIPAYEQQGDYKAAYTNLKELIVLKDSIQGQETKKKIIQMEVQYAFEKKAATAQAAQEKKDIRQRSIRNGLIAGLSLLIIFLIIVFRQRNKVKREQKRSDELLLNILPAKVADELKENGKAKAHRFDNITVLFTDFVNFTGTAETLTPEELVGELNECFTAFDNIMERRGLEKIKTVGDAYMAVCGLPNSSVDHAQRAVRAAVDIMDFMQQRSLTEKVFGIRIGINSGPVVAGIVGVKKFAYDIWGDTVNTAARMEQKSEAGKINISDTTYELVKDDFECLFRGEIEAKNKGRLKMYFIA